MNHVKWTKISKPGFLLLFPEPGTPPSGTEEVLGLSFLVAHLQAGEGLWSIISGSPTSGAGEGLGSPVVCHPLLSAGQACMGQTSEKLSSLPERQRKL